MRMVGEVRGVEHQRPVPIDSPFLLSFTGYFLKTQLSWLEFATTGHSDELFLQVLPESLREISCTISLELTKIGASPICR